MHFADIVGGTLRGILGRRLLWRIGRMLYYLGRHDPENSMERNGEFTLQRHLARRASESSSPWIVFDVGANVGEWSASLFSAATEAGVRSVQLTAFEPEPGARLELDARLASAARPEDTARIVAMALSDAKVRSRFVVHSTAAGSNSLVSTASAPDADTIEVDVTTLDDFVREARIGQIDLLKIDAEGFDLKILQGAARLLQAGQVGVFQFEYNWRWVQTRSLLFDVFRLVTGSRYQLGKLVPEGVELYDAWHPELERFIEGNYVLVRDDLLGAVAAKTGTFDLSNTYDVD